MRHVDLCSGIGGFALAARWAGWETVGFCEIDPWCRQVLAQNFPGVPQHDDLKTLTADQIRQWTSDQYVLTAGYPCQPFSHAGKRGGTDDPRHLWPWIRELLAALGEDKPRWCVFENVAGHVSLGLDRVLSDLEGQGYACWASIVPAAGVGALHRRDRVWIVAHDVAYSAGSSAGWVREGDRQPRVGPAGSHSGLAGGSSDGALANHVSDKWRAWTQTERGLCGTVDGLSVGMDDPLEYFGRGWEYEVPLTTNEPSRDRVTRLKGLGNAIVPQVAYVIFDAIIRAEQESAQ